MSVVIGTAIKNDLQSLVKQVGYSDASQSNMSENPQLSQPRKREIETPTDIALESNQDGEIDEI